MASDWAWYGYLDREYITDDPYLCTCEDVCECEQEEDEDVED